MGGQMERILRVRLKSSAFFFSWPAFSCWESILCAKVSRGVFENKRKGKGSAHSSVPLSKLGPPRRPEAGAGGSGSAANGPHGQEASCFWDDGVWVAEIASCREMLFKREQNFTTTTKQ